MKKSIVFIGFIIFSFVMYQLLGFEYHTIPSGLSLEAPSRAHILGTDDIGIDIFAQLIYGGGYSLLIGIVSASLATGVGVLAGIAAGYYGGVIDEIVTGAVDVLASIPQMILLILLGTFLGASFVSLVLVLMLISWSQTARMVRAKVIFIKNEMYIKMSELYGAKFLFIAIHHILPSIKELVVLSFIKIMSRSILLEASLAYLGLSDPTSKSWGLMINRAMSFSGIYFTPFWKWWLLPPLIGLILLVLSLMQIGRSIERKGI